MPGGVEEAAVLQESGALGRAVRGAPRGAAEVTVVVPTRDERENVLPLTARLLEVDRETPLEVLFVDDSDDDTPAVIRDLARRSSLRVCVIHRAANRRDGGLGGAVLAGIRAARTEWICVMDADLQHPPELLRPLLVEAHRSKADVVVASRYCTGGDVGDFTPAREALSRFSAVMARALFPSRLRAVSDPLSGFFLIRRAAVDPTELRPRGFKILLEILVRGTLLTTSEVPFRFGERYAGESKASLREGLRYLHALIELRADFGRNRTETRPWEPPSALSTAPPPRFRHERPAVWNRNGTAGHEHAPHGSVLT